MSRSTDSLATNDSTDLQRLPCCCENCAAQQGTTTTTAQAQDRLRELRMSPSANTSTDKLSH